MKTKTLYICMDTVVQTITAKDLETGEKRETMIAGCFGYLPVYESEVELITMNGEGASIMTIHVPDIEDAEIVKEG